MPDDVSFWPKNWCLTVPNERTNRWIKNAQGATALPGKCCLLLDILYIVSFLGILILILQMVLLFLKRKISLMFYSISEHHLKFFFHLNFSIYQQRRGVSVEIRIKGILIGETT